MPPTHPSTTPRFLRRPVLPLVLFFFLSITLALTASPLLGQDNPLSPVSSAPIDTSALSFGKFYDKELDLHFNYPREMKVLDGKAEMETGHENLFGEAGEKDPEHRQAARCIRFHLALDLPKENAPQHMANDGGLWIDDTKEYKDSRKPQPIFAKIVVMEFLPACLPKPTPKNFDGALASMARDLVSLPGLLPAPKPLWYEVAKQKIHMNWSIGRFKMNGHLDEAPMIVMAMSTEWRGHLLMWAFTSNDASIFNQLTKSLVQFGDGPWGQMFPGNLGPSGSGTPLNILPN